MATKTKVSMFKNKYILLQKFWIKIMFLSSFVKGLGGFRIFLGKAFSILMTTGFNGVKLKTVYILHHAGILSNPVIDGKNYKKWLKLFGLLTDKDLINMRLSMINLKIQPVFSVIMPTYNSNPKWLKEAIESVINQVYPNWELCIADDASKNPKTLEVLNFYQNKDHRIKVIFRSQNGHISLASNSAVEIASGDFIALLDHDDLLPKDALFWVANAINKNPGASLIYSDEDKIENSGKRSDPYFKCDWNYSLFLSQNMISHLGVYRTKILKEIGGFREGYEGSQDYDLALRFIEKIDSSQIIHIPRILYHWRIHPFSTAKVSDIKPYAVINAQKAISDHLHRKNVSATVEILPTFMYRVKYHLPEKLPFVSIIIPTRNNKSCLEKCISSLLSKTTYHHFEVLIIDNNSDDFKTLDFLNSLKADKRIKILKDTMPFNFSAINNRAVSHVRGEHLCFLNDDTEVISPDWLGEMVSIILQPGIGIVGAKLWYPDKTLQHGGVILGIGGVGAHAHKGIPYNNHGYFNRANLIQEFSAVTAACMLIQKKLFDEVGGFDEGNLGVAFNDVDLCLKVRSLGYRIVWTPYSELYHHESTSRGDDFHPEKIDRFFKENDFIINKWGEIIKNDPYYSPNLTLGSEDFGLAWPPRINHSGSLTTEV